MCRIGLKTKTRTAAARSGSQSWGSNAIGETGSTGTVRGADLAELRDHGRLQRIVNPGESAPAPSRVRAA
jgi:hypothetical protein